MDNRDNDTPPEPTEEETVDSTELIDQSVVQPLGTRAAASVIAILCAAIGGTAAGSWWISSNGLRGQAEAGGRQAAATAATAFATLAEPSAANVARTLDVVLDDQLRAQAAATALLIEAAEASGQSTDYIEDALRQIAIRSPIERIDVSASEGEVYTTARRGHTLEDLEPEFQALAGGSDGSTAVRAARETAGGITKAAAAQTLHRNAVVRIEQALDPEAAARTYGGQDDGFARRIAERQAAAIASLATHAIELAEDAGWGRGQIEVRLGYSFSEVALLSD